APIVHQIGLLKPAFAGDDIAPRHHCRAAWRNKAVRLRGCTVVGDHGRPRDQSEANDRDDEENPFENVADWVVGGWGVSLRGFRHLSLTQFAKSRQLSSKPNSEKPIVQSGEKSVRIFSVATKRYGCGVGVVCVSYGFDNNSI